MAGDQIQEGFTREWRDVKACIAFLLMFLTALVLLGVSAATADYDNLFDVYEDSDDTPSPTTSPSVESSDVEITNTHIGQAVGMFVGVLIFSAIWGAISLKLLKTQARCLMYTGLAIQIGLAWLLFIMTGSFVMLIILLLLPLMYFFVFYRNKNGVEFALWIVETAVDIINDRKSVVPLALFWLLCQAVVVGGLFFGVLTTNEAFNAVAALFMIFMVYWVEEVFKNVIGVTMSLVTADWCLDLQTINEGAAVSGSFYHSLTYSLGSIALGSLVVAILKFLRLLATIAMTQDDNAFGVFIACCCRCFIGLLEGLAEWFNEWAYAYIGLYQKDYITSAKKVFKLLGEEEGWDAIRNDIMTDLILSVPPLVAGVLCGVTCGLLSAYAFDWSSSASIFAGIVGGIIALVLVALVMGLIDRAQNVIFLAYIENRARFVNKHPQIVAELESRLVQRWEILEVQVRRMGGNPPPPNGISSA